VRLLPATDDRMETHVVVDRGAVGEDAARAEAGVAVDGGGAGEAALHFQEWWVRYRGGVPARRFVFAGAETAKPAPGVLDALAAADVVLVAPSNPVVSIAPILAVASLREALVAGAAPVVGISPIIGGAPVRGMADKCLAALVVECSAAGVGRLYGARRHGGVLDAWLVDPVDGSTTVEDVTVRSVPLWMTDEAATEEMARVALDVADV
jgi:LPPG:FO 2-phospho-L-lactate transferase